MDISPAANGQERTGATGTFILVLLLLLADISPASNGRERTGAPGTNSHTLVLNVAATQIL